MGLHAGFAVAAMAAGGVLAASAQADVLNRWVQYGPDDTVLIRSISSANSAACPSLAIDGQPVTMHPRFPPTVEFPIVMCEVSRKLGNYAAKTATIDGVDLKLPIADPKRILIVGDTGCRVNGETPQDCNNHDGPLDFPLAPLSDYAALFRPDTIIHTGDFYYREQPCPTGFDKQCGRPDGVTSGDIWEIWDADWFTPARRIMQTAPLAITRGNHESCDRGAAGWFRLLAVQPYSDTAANCGPRSGFSSYRSVTRTNSEPSNRDPNDTTPSYVVQAGAVALIMFDISYASDTIAQPGLNAQYVADLKTSLAKLQDKPAIFVAHKPVFGLNVGAASAQGEKTPGEKPSGERPSGERFVGGGNVNEQLIFGRSVPPQISLFVSGHTHNFEVVDLGSPDLAPQLVIGNSGTLLDGLQVDVTQLPEHPTYRVTSSREAGEDVAARYLTDVSDFGFAVLDAVKDGGATSGYTADIYNLHATKSASCVISLRPRTMTCGR
jgi:Calcineurin-like phosphoesterase